MAGNRELAERFIASLEARDWEGWAALLHPDVVLRDPPVAGADPGTEE